MARANFSCNLNRRRKRHLEQQQQRQLSLAPPAKRTQHSRCARALVACAMVQVGASSSANARLYFGWPGAKRLLSNGYYLCRHHRRHRSSSSRRRRHHHHRSAGATAIPVRLRIGAGKAASVRVGGTAGAIGDVGDVGDVAGWLRAPIDRSIGLCVARALTNSKQQPPSPPPPRPPPPLLFSHRARSLSLSLGSMNRNSAAAGCSL